MSVKLFSKIFATVLLINCSYVAAQYASKANEERSIIYQYFNYIDIITRIKLDNMLEMTGTFVKQLLDSIPFDKRGNSAEMLQLFIDQSERVQDSVLIEEKEAVLLQLQQLIATIKTEMVKQEQEDLIIRRGLLGTFELLARLSIEDRKFNEKFVKASVLLRRKFTPEGIQNNAGLFSVISAIEQEEDIVEREALTRRFKEIKQNY